MHFGLSEEQQQLATTLHSLLGRHADSAKVRSAAESAAGYDPGLWRTLCEQVGVAALAVPEEYDGAGFTLFETGIVLDALGRSLAPSPLLASVVTAEVLLAADDTEACSDLLPRIAAGEVATLAWSGVAGPADSALTVRADGDRLHGEVSPVLHGDSATILLVPAETDTGPALFLVDPDEVTATWAPGMDPTIRYADLTLDGAAARRIGGDARTALDHAHRVGTVAVASLQLGGAQRALDDTVTHSRERVQFGRPIGSFQALKHRMADMLVEVELSRSAAWAATYAVASDSPDAATLAASAGSYCSEAFFHVAGEAVQLHGGIGITWEHDVSVVFKRAHALQQLFGLPHQHRSLIEL
ncbi:MAG: acyl-CoA/acyl-ACP dehydrogenase [Nocardioides sp.]|nr:acyl-CoA/acyl-ACP dehydrogenase [Nocardioides sp.]